MDDQTSTAITCRCGGTGREWDFDHNSVDVGPCLECEVRRLNTEASNLRFLIAQAVSDVQFSPWRGWNLRVTLTLVRRLRAAAGNGS